MILAWGLYRWQVESWRWLGMLNIGGLVTLVALLIFAFRKSAYIQTSTGYLRLATPFLRLNISYKRLRRTTTATMHALFPPHSLSNWRREIMEPLGKMTAIVVELNGYPISQFMLRFFLSPFFFKDKTPHFVILVEDWMGFSLELESLRFRKDIPAAQRE